MPNYNKSGLNFFENNDFTDRLSMQLYIEKLAIIYNQ